MAHAVGENSPANFSANEANELVAAANAIALCQQNAAQPQRCELVHLNNEAMTTGASLKAELNSKLGKQPHPLFMWRYSNAKTTLFLTGSVHVLKPSSYPLPVQFEEAFSQAQTLVLEVNLADLNKAELQQAFQQRALLPAQQSLSQQLGPNLTRRVATQLSRYGIEIASLSRFKPAAVTQQLVMLRLVTMGYPNNSGVEQHFLAKLNGRRVQALETIGEQLDLLFNQPMPVQIALLEETLEQFDQVDQQMSELVLAWMAGDDQRMLAEFKAQAGSSAEAKLFYEKLLDDRNITMANKIAALLNKPGTHLVVVGAAHCAGDKGIVRLLKERGLAGQRIWSNQEIRPATTRQHTQH